MTGNVINLADRQSPEVRRRACDAVTAQRVARSRHLSLDDVMNDPRTSGSACPIPSDVARRHDELLDSVTHTENRVMDFPSTTIADLHAKIVFMVDRGLFGVLNPSATLLADAARLAGVEA